MLPDGSMVLFDAAKAMAYPINCSAALIWNASDGSRDQDDIAQIVFATYDAPLEQVSRDVNALVLQLLDIGVLQVVT
jgi:hypothetical protein